MNVNLWTLFNTSETAMEDFEIAQQNAVLINERIEMMQYFRAVLIDDNEKRNSTFTFIHLIVKICKNQITDYFRLFSILFFFKINSNASKLVIIHSIDVKAEKIWKYFRN